MSRGAPPTTNSLPWCVRRVAKFNGVHSIDLHFPANHGADVTEVCFIGFKGEFSERRREAVTAVYETRAVPKDHTVPSGEQGAGWNIGM